MIILQLALFCALFTLMVKIGVGNNALNGLYFYPKPVQEKVHELGTCGFDAACRKEIDNNNAFRVNRMRKRFLPADS